MTSGDIYYGVGGWTRKPIDELRIPRTVQDAVQRRTDQLSQETRGLSEILRLSRDAASISTCCNE